MRYAIYGVNRVAKDFLYIFDKLEIVCFFEDTSISSFERIPVYDIANYNSVSGIDKIIICDFEKTKKIGKMKSLNLKYGTNYLYEEDFFSQLDEHILNEKGKTIAVWGTGRRANELLQWDHSLDVDVYMDSYKYGRMNQFCGKEIFSPDEIIKKKNHFIIVAVAKKQEIVDKLEKLGYRRWTDYCLDYEWKACPSHLLRMTIFDTHYYEIGCTTMLNHIEIGAEGVAACCCGTFIYHSIGNLLENSLTEMWNGVIHKILCLSNVNGTYSFCNKDMCPFFVNPRRKTVDLQRHYPQMESWPTTLAVNYDGTCNLKCITCRNDYYVANGKDRDVIDIITEKIKQEVIPKCEFFITAGNGETLFARQYREILMNTKLDNIRWIRLLTNGLLFTKENWEKIRQNTKAKIMMTVSIDAASKETYIKIRRGGNFDILVENMNYAAELRKKGLLSYLRFNFVVQRDNYMEMPDFIKWGKRIGVDEVFFTKLLNWGTYSDSEFSEVSMMEKDGITPKRELMDILQDPVMKDPIVDMGTIRYGHSVEEQNDRNNYYRWELERKVASLFT